MSERILALVDGEHYLPVTRAALEALAAARGGRVVAALFVGGTEKIGDPSDLASLGVEVARPDDVLAGLAGAIDRFRPDVVFDLSDEPVLGYRERFRIASVVLERGVRYEGADFAFAPPERPHLSRVPSVVVAGTGKRVGKTAVAAYVARVLSGRLGPVEPVHRPVMITMGRGGPPEPVVVRGDRLEMTADYLIARADEGAHAASDHYEDACMTRLPVVGCRRAGGGMAGVVYHSTVPAGAEVAASLGGDLHIYEGSGSTLPPAAGDAQLMVVGAHQPIDYLTGYLGPFRVATSDVVFLTMCEEPMAGPADVEARRRALLDLKPDLVVVRIVFRPRPLGDLMGRTIVYASTACVTDEEAKQQYQHSLKELHQEVLNR